MGTRFDWDSTNGRALRSAAETLGVTMILAEHTPTDFTDAFALLVRERPDALFVAVQPSTTAKQRAILDYALERRIPGAYPWRQYVDDGGLMSYGVSLPDQYRLAADYVDRILKGEKPGDMPIQQPVKFEFVINLKTAKAIGLEIPTFVLAQADEVIE